MLNLDVALGGYIRIKKLNPESSDSLPAVTTYRIYEGQNTVERLIDMRDVDQSLFQLLQSEKITRREAQLMHNSFATLIENVDIEERNEAVRQLYDNNGGYTTEGVMIDVM